MKRFQQMLKLFLVVALLGMSAVVAQTGGTLSGRVTDAQSGEYLPGANVILEGTNIGGATDREGSFRLVNIPAGNYTLVAHYIGYNDYSSEVVVATDITVTQNVGMSIGYVEMGDVVVEGLRQGAVKALSMQKNANNIKNVVSQEQMEAFPDANVAEVIQRIPGVHIERSGGEGRYVLIRGTEPRLSTITVNGAALATSRQQERYSQLDVMGSNQMAMIEVVKALTPDMDANSVGGAVNVITRSAFDNAGRKAKVTIGSGYTGLGGKFMGQAKLNYSDIFANGKLGYNITANWDRKQKDQDGMEYDWDDAEDVSGNEIPYAITDIFQNASQITKTRLGVGGGLEYRPSPGNRFYTSLMWNKYADDNARTRIRVRVDKGDYLNPEGTLTEKSRIIREHKYRIEDLFQSHYTFGGEHELGNSKLDYSVAYSEAKEEHIPQLESEWDFSEKVNLNMDMDNPETVKYTMMNGDFDEAEMKALFLDPTQYEFSEFDWREQLSTNNNTVAGANYEMPMNLAGFPTKIKVGGKYTAIFKNRSDTRIKYDWEGDEDLTLDMWESDQVRDDFMNDNYEFGPIIDPDQPIEFLEANMADFDGSIDEWDSYGGSYEINENVMAGYAMANVDLGRFHFIGGARYEMTSNEFLGTNLIFDDDGDYESHAPVDETRDYNNIFPMFHLNHDLTANTKLRVAYTSTMSRPNYYDLAPYFFANEKKEEIRAGNKDLEPTMSSNIDFMAEHYLSGIGLVSGSFFYKDLTNIIFERTNEIEDTASPYNGWDIEHPVNGGDATLFGYELSLQQELTFLPGALSGLGVNVNYTHTWAEAELLHPKEGEDPRKGFLPGQAGDAANLSLSYETGRFSSHLSYSYQGAFLTEVGKDEDHDEWMNSHSQIDFTGNFKVASGLNVFLDLVNLTNEPKLEYMGNSDRLIKVSYYGFTSRLGVKYSL
jgi:TonB-dependent receptor